MICALLLWRVFMGRFHILFSKDYCRTELSHKSAKKTKLNRLRRRKSRNQFFLHLNDYFWEERIGTVSARREGLDATLLTSFPSG
jgi:hypothetical protein